MNILRTLFFLILIAGGSISSSAQTPFTYWDSIPVIQWGDTIKYPFAGGFNNPQFSSIDLNGDGIQDLFVFDRSTNKVYTFLNTGTTGQSSYIYAPQYQKKFPSELSGWVLLKDYNCDGKTDIFTSRNNSFAVYRNDFTTGTGLSFSFVETFNQNLFYIIDVDIPAINDIDNDGDLDLLSFDPAGMYIYYLKNLSIENFGTCDSLTFVLAEHCWGSCSESFFTCDITLGDSLTPCRMHTMPTQNNTNIEELRNGSLHPGNTILALDLNADNKKEIIIGPQICTNAVMLTNCSTPLLLDSMIAQVTSYPDTIHPITFSLFPATFYEDINNDGKKDLLAAPNRGASEDTASSWCYIDTSSSSVPKFEFQKKDFLQSDMIDVGEGSNPVFFDFDGDSLLDILIGNNYYYSTTAPNPAVLALYKNTGTKHSPAFKLITRDYSNLSTLNLNGLYPAFGDLDSDGDQDMILGESSGHLYYFTNTALPGNPANFILTGLQFDSIDVGQFAAPQIVDVNCDGKLDLLIGERSGTIKYFENIGTDSLSFFNKIPTNNEFGGIDVLPLCCTGYAIPYLMTDSDGNYQLLVGTESDSIYSFTNIDNNINGNFQLSNVVYAGINEGKRATVSGGDLDNDGMLDLVVGNYAGGITLFKGHEQRPLKNCKPPVEILPFSIISYPNPVPQTEALTFHIFGLNENDKANIDIFNVVGQRIYHDQPTAQSNDWTISIPVSNFATGIYFLQISIPSHNGSSTYYHKFMVSN